MHSVYSNVYILYIIVKGQTRRLFHNTGQGQGVILFLLNCIAVKSVKMGTKRIKVSVINGKSLCF